MPFSLQVMTVKRRYEVGLEKLMSTEESVQGMKEMLIALQPQLEESTRQTEAAMVVITKESADADVVKQVLVSQSWTPRSCTSSCAVLCT